MAIKPIVIIYSDIDEHLVKDNQGNIAVTYNTEAVQTALYNILCTNKGERLGLPQFGANLSALLFENMDSNFASILSNQIKTEVTKWDPRINLLSITYNPDGYNLNQANVVIRFNAIGNDTTQQLVIPIK